MFKLRNALVCAALLAVPVVAHAQGTTVLTFNIQDIANFTPIPQDYGDNVTGPLMGTFSYGGSNGFTPNISVMYDLGGSTTAFWNVEYGDLTNVAYTVSPAVRVTLSAQPGFSVTLNSFDLGGWQNQDYTVNSVRVIGPGNAILFEQLNVPIEGDFNGPRHSPFVFNNLTSNSFLAIIVDVSNLNFSSDNIGIDNVSFTQNVLGGGATAPEPGTTAFVLPLLVTGVGIAIRRRMTAK
jgi:hypothetical protein